MEIIMKALKLLLALSCAAGLIIEPVAAATVRRDTLERRYQWLAEIEMIRKLFQPLDN